MARLPQDVMTEILSRLPVKSLLRFRCVSKTFCGLIDSQYFIKLHMNRSIETNSNLSLILVDERRFIRKLDDAVEIDDYPFKDSCDFSNIKIFSSCNGLVAVKTRPRSREIALWNPSTKKHRILPKCCDDDNGSFKCANGFGYDAASDDYKLVRILQSGDDEFTGDSVYVYSLRTNYWRQIKELPFPFFDAHGGGAFVSGALHWLARTTPEVAKYDLVVAFDLKSEEFYQVPLPLVEDDGYFHVLEDFKGCLCLTRDYDMYEYDYLESFSIWVMKEYGVMESWTQRFNSFFSSANLLPSAKPLAHLKYGDGAIIYEKDGVFYWYDLDELVEDGVPFHDVPIRFIYANIICLDSLVSLDAYTRHGAVVSTQKAESLTKEGEGEGESIRRGGYQMAW